MDDRHAETPEPAAPNLRAAMRAARVEDAERSQALAELRGAELARLEMLEDALQPVLAQVPAEAEMFDCGVVPGPRPRLFVDMIAFVEMAHDKRLYRLVQSTRHGRCVLAESERIDAMVDAITAYIARRLVDREKALASAEADVGAAPVRDPAPVPVKEPVGADPEASEDKPPRRGVVGTIGRLGLEYLGIIVMCALIVVLARFGFEYWQSLQQ